MFPTSSPAPSSAPIAHRLAPWGPAGWCASLPGSTATSPFHAGLSLGLLAALWTASGCVAEVPRRAQVDEQVVYELASTTRSLRAPGIPGVPGIPIDPRVPPLDPRFPDPNRPEPLPPPRLGELNLERQGPAGITLEFDCTPDDKARSYIVNRRSPGRSENRNLRATRVAPGRCAVRDTEVRAERRYCYRHAGDSQRQELCAFTDATFAWQLHERVQLSHATYDIEDGSYPRDYVRPDRWSLDLNACGYGHDADQYRFVVRGADGLTRFTGRSSRCQTTTWLRSLGRTDVTLELYRDGRLAQNIRRVIHPSDTVLVSFGDSFAAGEGVPDEPGNYLVIDDDREVVLGDPEFEAVLTYRQRLQAYATKVDCERGTCRIEAPQTGSIDLYPRLWLPPACRDSLQCGGVGLPVSGCWFECGQAQLDEPLPGKFAAEWVDPTCHRSAKGAHAVAARKLEDKDHHSSVTFLSYACSGGTIPEVLDVSQHPNRAPQLDRALADLCIGGDCRDVDTVLLTIGGNDMGFADVVTFCAVEDWLEGQIKQSGVDYPRHCPAQDDDPFLVSRFQRLSTRYSALDDALRQALDPSDIVISEYPVHFFEQEDGSARACESFKDFPANMRGNEARWLMEVGQELNDAIARHASDLGWLLADGVEAAVRNRGYCTSLPFWVRSHDSLREQGDDRGTIHPNINGAHFMGQHIGEHLPLPRTVRWFPLPNFPILAVP